MLEPDRASSLKELYPELFVRSSALPSINKGWMTLIDRLCAVIHPLAMAERETCICGHPEMNHPVMTEQSGITVKIRLPTGEKEFDLAESKPKPITRVLCDTYRPSKPHFREIKQKLGTLRIYFARPTPLINVAINAVIEEASRTCEDCGRPGSLVEIGKLTTWLGTLCEKCAKFRRIEKDGWLLQIQE